MKKTIRSALLTLAVCGTAVFLSACSKKDETVVPTAAETEKAMGNAVDAVKKQADSTVTAVENAAADAQKQAQSLIDRIKQLVTDKKYSEAMTSLTELGKLKLTPEQQKWLDDMKSQIQKAMASDGAKAFEGLAK